MIPSVEIPELVPPSQSSDDLHIAFDTFNQLSKQLTESYQILESRVAGLNTELAAARDEKTRELSEKKRLASRLTLLIDSLPGGIIVLDGLGAVQECNPVAVDLLGKPLIGQKWLDIIQRAFATNQFHDHNITLKDGRNLNLSTCPLGNEPGQILLLTDVSEMHQLQEKLNQQQRLAAMGETAASLAHQIRTPLSSVMLYTSNLKTPDMSEAYRMKLSEKIISRLRHLEQLISNMLLYARGDFVMEDDINVADLVYDLSDTIDAQLNEKNIDFIINSHVDDIFVAGNYQMLLSALMNLCVNAIQAVGDGGKLTVQIKRSPQKIISINVTDNGPGIEREKQKTIFKPFVTAKQDGTGLGLAVVAAVIKAHKGKISIDSEPGRGCSFCISLPEKYIKVANV